MAVLESRRLTLIRIVCNYWCVPMGVDYYIREHTCFDELNEPFDV